MVPPLAHKPRGQISKLIWKPEQTFKNWSLQPGGERPKMTSSEEPPSESLVMSLNILTCVTLELRSPPLPLGHSSLDQLAGLRLHPLRLEWELEGCTTPTKQMQR